MTLMRRSSTTVLSIAAIAALSGIATLAVPVAAAGHTFTVRATGDRGDRDIGDGRCDTTAAAATTKCTLRAAIQEADSDAAEDRIVFAIETGSDPVKTISPASALPAITQRLVIDGYTQAGAAPNTASPGSNAKLRIVIDGSDAHGQPGLQSSARVTIRGLVVSRFGRGIQLSEGSDGSSIVGNFIGTDASGKVARGNAGSGILVNAADVRVGSIARSDRNLVSGNDSAGISLGIAAKSTTVQGNLIGTRRGATGDLGNGGDGIFVTGSDGHLLGGSFAGQGNVIAYNHGSGINLVTVSSPSLGNLVPARVRMLGNSIFRNVGIGIDLGDDGVTTNDPVPDSDKGPNGRQNFPRLDSAVAKSGDTTIKGRLGSRKNVTFEVQLFGNTAGDPEGRVFLGGTTVTTGADGKATFTFKAGQLLAVGSTITATATDLVRQQTSEFGPARAVTRP